MTFIFALLLIAASLHAQDLYAPTRPAMRRGPELATVSPSRQAAIAKALIAPDPHDLMVLLGMPDQQRHSPDVAVVTATTPPHLDQESERVADRMAIARLWAAAPQPPQPQLPTTQGVGVVRPSNIACMESISGNHTICPSPAVQPPASLVQPPPITIAPCRECITAPISPLAAPPSELYLGDRSPIFSQQRSAGLAQPPPGPVLSFSPDVIVTVSPMSRAASERILGKRIGKIAMVWLVVLENRTFEPVLIAPSAIYRHISHLQPFDHIVMSQLIEEGVKNSFLARSGRAADDVGKLSAFMIASKTIQIAETWPLALVTGAGWAIPYLIQRLKGAETPVAVNFERLAWTVPIALGPGETATSHIFSEIWDSPSPVSFSLDVSQVPLRKSLQ